MRYFLISDNSDTLTGLRLAGIEGVLCKTKEETLNAISDAEKDPDIGILLINEKLAALCPEQINSLKLTSVRPLLVEIPDRHHTGRAPDSITRYIREAIGIKV
jgi:V/A-type H+-transporting ATPase subunit F